MIQVQHLSKSFESIQALNNISFSINKGEIYGLLGPNGAGKSTTINILSTLLQADSGQVFINGANTLDQIEKVKLAIGVVPQEIALYDNLSAYDNLMFWGSFYKISKKELEQRALSTLELVGLSDRKDDLIKTYSGGMKRRINIAASILHKPEVLLMDEPTVGVDPQSRNHVFEVIEKLNKQGMTIIYTTHYMEEAERLCDRIGIIDKGQIVAEGTLNELKNQSKVKDVLAVTLKSLSDTIKAKLKSQIASISFESESLYIESASIDTDISSMIAKIQQSGGEIERIDTKKANLESVFLKLTGKQLRD